MKRDMELIRKILIAIEENTHDGPLYRFPIEGYSNTEVSYHVGLLADAGWIKARHTLGTGRGWWQPIDLTWDGHEFLDNVRNETVWTDVKKQVAAQGGSVALSIIQQLAMIGAKALFGLP